MKEFGGTWVDPIADLKTEAIDTNDQPFSIKTIIPATSVLYIRPKRISGVKK